MKTRNSPKPARSASARHNRPPAPDRSASARVRPVSRNDHFPAASEITSDAQQSVARLYAWLNRISVRAPDRSGRSR